MISSKQNPKVKLVRQLQESSQARRQARLFVVEGVRLVEEALVNGWQAELVFFTSELSQRGHQVVQGFASQGAQVEEVSPAVMEAVTDTQTPQGILAVLKQQTPELPQRLDFVFIPDLIRDPGNLGSMLRTAAAAGVQAVWIPPGTVDPFSPKVLRSAMGAHFRLPIISQDWDSIHNLCAVHHLTVHLASAGAGIHYTQVDFHLPTCLVVGGEAEGASNQALQLAQQQIFIPMPGGIESLNAAAAAAILLFEIVRQRTTS